MKNFASANKYLSAAFALAAIVAAGTAPASAQSRDHTGSMMPFYYDGEGGQKTGAWSKEEEGGNANKAATANQAGTANKTATANKAGTANKQAAQPARSLYLFAGKRSPHQDVQVH
jgi:hypothetical protein